MTDLTSLRQHAVELLQLGQIEQAHKICTSLLKEHPRDYIVLNTYGLCLQALRQFKEAEDVFTQAITVCPTCATAYVNLANLNILTGNSETAEHYFKIATSVASNDYLAHLSYATYLFAKCDYDTALSLYTKAALLNPQIIPTIIQKAFYLKHSDAISIAIKYFEKSLHFVPKDINLLTHLGGMLINNRQFDKAEEIYKTLLDLEPNTASHWFNLGLVYNGKDCKEKAKQAFIRAVQLEPNFAEARWNLSLLQLAEGNYTEGWQNYEFRQYLDDFAPYKRAFTAPTWQGQDIRDKTLLIYDEQGFGDAIQFIRFAPLAKEYCNTLIVQCSKSLVRLFASLSCISYVYEHSEQLPHFDYHCSILSLPAIFKTTLQSIPATVPYLSSIYSKRAYLKDLIRQDKAVLKVALSWLGKSPKEKSCPLELFKVLAHRDISFYNIQKYDEQNEGAYPPKELRWVNLVDKIADFSDTAAIIEEMDLVITVCTANAHLAGALGKPVWIMLLYDADWRWLKDRADSPWYPTARLFRQSRSKDWTSVLAEIKKELFGLLEVKKSSRS